MNNKLKEIKSNDKLIVTYSYLLSLLEDFQNDGISSLGDSDNISMIPEKEIYNAVKDGDIEIME
ncbi:hypothetical protein J6W34_03555 [bacterium]|nr:hypothetical protein [bacterium]